MTPSMMAVASSVALCGTVRNGEFRGRMNGRGSDELTGLEDHFQHMAVGRHGGADGVDHGRCGGRVAREKRTVGKHQVDVVGAIGQGLEGHGHHVVDRFGTTGKVHHGGDAHVGAPQLFDGECHVSRPHAHRGRVAMRAVRPGAERDHVIVGGAIAQLGEIEECDRAAGEGNRIVRHAITLTRVENHPVGTADSGP
jgi:hypothetical protein